MNLKKEEIELVGEWVFQNGEIIENSVAKRINLLKDNYLIKVTTDKSGWNTLYQDPEDKRYWELTYRDSELQGGGAPLLTNITKEDAILKFNLDDSQRTSLC